MARRTKEQIERDSQIIWETVNENQEINSSAELVSQLAKKGHSLTWYQICYALGDKKEDLLSILKQRRHSETKKNEEKNHEETKNKNKNEEYDSDTVWTIDASVISAPKEMNELLRFLGSVPWIALTYVTLFEILKFIECTEKDDMSRGAKAFLDFYLENHRKFINIRSSDSKELDLSKLSNTERDDLLVKICRDKKLSLITSDRAMAVKAVFSGCEVRYLKKVASGNSIPPLKKVGEEYYFRGTSTSEVRYSILVKDTSSVYPSISKDTSSGYTPVNRGDYLYVAKKGFFAAYIIDVDWTYCLLYTIKFFNKYTLPKDLTEYTL